jgi:hypothetical protein
LSQNVFTHIPVESLQGVKLNFVQGFKRGDLPLKRWTVIKTQVSKIGQSALKITRDSEYIIIRDVRKPIREDLTEEELAKWSTPSFNNYLSKRAVTKKSVPSKEAQGAKESLDSKNNDKTVNLK